MVQPSEAIAYAAPNSTIEPKRRRTSGPVASFGAKVGNWRPASSQPPAATRASPMRIDTQGR